MRKGLLRMQTTNVIGLGYIGLPTAALLASNGIQVYGMDCIPHIVDTINAGNIHIVEPGLKKLVQTVVKDKKLIAYTTPQKADVYIIAVPTPFKENKEPDISYVKAAAEEIAPYLEEGNLIILESTSPVGTTENIKKWILEKVPALCDKKLYFAHCPERVLPGKILYELVHNDRIIGGIDSESTQKAVHFYKQFVEGELLETDAKTAEMTKLTENSFRDVNIAFANELSCICDKLGINVWKLIELANHHPRVNILQPGPGVGGHCIAVDPWFIVSSAPHEAKLIRTAREINDDKREFVIGKIESILEKEGIKKVTCLGLAFKPDIDDLRESPAMYIVEKIAERNMQCPITVVEPNIDNLPAKLAQYHNVRLNNEIEKAIKDADIIVILVDHTPFKKLPTDIWVGKEVVDTKGIIGGSL